MEKEIKISIDHLSEEELLNQLTFLLEKEAWEKDDLAWLSAYLEQTDGHLLKKMLYQFFIDEHPFKDGQRSVSAKAEMLEKLHSLLFK